MPRRGIQDLPKPLRRFRPGRRHDFETATKAGDEDATRARLLKRTVKKTPGAVDVAGAERLCKRLSYAKAGKPPPKTMASSWYMRRHRMCIGGWLWQLVETGKFGRVSTCTLIPTGLRFTPEELATVDARKLMEMLRADLNRCGAKGATGWGLFALHGEHEPESDYLQLHYHGVVADGMIDVVDRARTRRKYKRAKVPPGSPLPVYRPVVVSREPLFNLPEPLTYAVKSYWPSKRIGPVDEDGRVKRVRRGCRIPEPVHSQVLLWLDQWKLEDITLLVKLSATGNGFKVSKQKNARKS